MVLGVGGGGCMGDGFEGIFFCGGGGGRGGCIGGWF